MAIKTQQVNGFIFFCELHRNGLKVRNPKWSSIGINSILAQMWRDISQAQKLEYKKQAQLVCMQIENNYKTFVLI